MVFYHFLICLELHDVIYIYLWHVQDLFVEKVPGSNSKSQSLEWLTLRNNEELMGLWTQRDMAYAWETTVPLNTVEIMGRCFKESALICVKAASQLGISVLPASGKLAAGMFYLTTHNYLSSHRRQPANFCDGSCFSRNFLCISSFAPPNN